MGSIVCYQNSVKEQLLGVSPTLLAEEGAVCEEVARQMAQGARSALGCDLALSTTGVAGPDADDRGNPAGLVYVGLDTPEGTLVRKLQAGFRTREQVRTAAAQYGLDLVRRYLSGLLKP